MTTDKLKALREIDKMLVKCQKTESDITEIVRDLVQEVAQLSNNLQSLRERVIRNEERQYDDWI